VTAIFFELAKSGFAIFVQYFSTYQLIFGALATIPLFLIWVYLSWSIVLFGAQICHGLFSFEVNQKRNAEQPFIQLLKIIQRLSEKQVEGDTIAESELTSSGDWGSKEANMLWLEKLVEAGIVAKLESQDYCLKINHEDINFLMVYEVSGNLLPTLEDIDKSSLSEVLKEKIASLRCEMMKILSTKITLI